MSVRHGSPTLDGTAPAKVLGPPADHLLSDAQPDILWYDTSLDQLQIWFMDDSRIITRRTVVGPDGSPTGAPAPWQIAGAADFDRNGIADVLTHLVDSGETVIAYLDGNQRNTTRRVVLDENGKVAHAGAPWQIAGTADFNRDGRPDILWHNTSTDETQIWFMDDRSIIGRADVLEENGSPTRVGVPWQIAGVAGFNAFGGPDILWHNTSTDETQIWFMDGNHRIAQRRSVLEENGSPTHVGAPWQIAGTADFDNDGSPDILWHNTGTNETQIWYLSSERIIGRADVLEENGNPTHVGAPWQIAGIGYF
ncbi:FG-GAP repeat domain-containing protein [Kitasatospora sp. NPDC059599]|uniref:FG-GAP repeat domain-containing protein n=1 Tax=Kitasatospora sp. NPDC059599 TaxID=3346880 RepID=UPI0036CBD78F